MVVLITIAIYTTLKVCTTYSLIRCARRRLTSNYIENAGPSEPVQVLRDLHQGYLSCVRFTAEGQHMFTSSGDSRCAYWDVESGSSKKIFAGHKNGMNYIELNNCFADI